MALAVRRPDGETVTREVETGHARREENMVEFAGAGLALLRDVLLGKGEGEGEKL